MKDLALILLFRAVFLTRFIAKRFTYTHRLILVIIALMVTLWRVV